MQEENKLLSGYPISTHALTRIRDLGQNILRSNICNAEHPQANGNGSPVSSKPSSSGGDHGQIVKYFQIDHSYISCPPHKK